MRILATTVLTGVAFALVGYVASSMWLVGYEPKWGSLRVTFAKVCLTVFPFVIGAAVGCFTSIALSKRKAKESK